MTTAKIESAGPRDLAMHRDQYDRLVIELQELGFDAEIELWERRGALETASHIIIHLGEFGAAAKGLSDLVPVVRRTLRGPRRPPSGEPREVVIYGPNDEVLATIELDDEDEDGNEAG
jgi:hypothetical protein